MHRSTHVCTNMFCRCSVHAAIKYNGCYNNNYRGISKVYLLLTLASPSTIAWTEGDIGLGIAVPWSLY